MSENSSNQKPDETKYCNVTYRQHFVGENPNYMVEVKKVKVPLDMDVYDNNIAYKDNLEYFVQGAVDAGYMVIGSDFIPWSCIESISPCREVSVRKKRKPRRRNKPKQSENKNDSSQKTA